MRHLLRRVVPMIHVPDVAGTVAWYESIGFEVVETGSDGDAMVWAMVACGETKVMFNAGGDPSDRERREVDLYVYTDDVDALFETMRGRVELVEEPHDTFYGTREVIIRDLNRFWITFGREIGGSSSRFNHPTPELPVEDVERAQQYYRDLLGFTIDWLDPGKEIGAVSRDDAAIFFRKRHRPFEPVVNWVFSAEIDVMYHELETSGANIVEPLERKPWGLRQFSVEDLDGNRFHFHCD